MARNDLNRDRFSPDNGGPVERGAQENPPGLGEHGQKNGGGWINGPMPDPATPAPQYPRRTKTGP